MPSTFNLTDYSASYIASTNAVINLLGAATLTVYAGGQPATASIAATAGNTVLANFTMPATASMAVGATGIITIGPIADTTWAAAGTPAWSRMIKPGGTIFDCSTGTAATTSDITIDVSPVTAGAVAHIVAGPTYTVTQ